MKRAIEILFYVLLFSFVLPTGTIFHIPLKALLSALIIFLFILYRPRFRLDNLTKGFLFVILGLFIWSVIAILNGYLSTAASFSVSFISLLLTVWIGYELHEYDIVNAKKTLKMVSIISIIIILNAVVLSLLMSFGVDVIAFIKTVFNYEPITIALDLGGLMLFRVQMPNNTIPFIWLTYSLMSHRRIGYKIFAVLMVGLLTAITFSRVLIVEFVGIILASFILKLFQNTKHTKDQAIGIGFISVVIAIALIVLVVNFGSTIFDYIEKRFDSNLTQYSDSFREIQKEKLLEGFENSVLFGHGAGSYLDNYLRSTDVPYTYEKEYISFLYQFGIFGFIWIIGGTMLCFALLCLRKTDNNIIRWMAAISLIVWAIKPFFNPSFLSSNSGIIILSIYLYSHQERRCEELVSSPVVSANQQLSPQTSETK